MCSVNVAIQTGALPSKVRVVGSIPLPGTGSFFLPFFSFTSFLAFLTLCVYPGICSSVERVLRVYLAGFLPARASEQGNVIGLWCPCIYIICVIKKIVIEQTRDLIYFKFVVTDFSLKIISPSTGENSGDSA